MIRVVVVDDDFRIAGAPEAAEPGGPRDKAPVSS